MKLFHIVVYGCSRRGIDAARIKDYFLRNKLVETDDPAEADYIVMVTCGLTEFETLRVQESVKDLQKHKGELLVYGCLPAMDPAALDGIFDGKILFTKDIENIDELFSLPVRMADVPDANFAVTHFDDRLSNNSDGEAGLSVELKSAGLPGFVREIKWNAKWRLNRLKFEVKSLFEKKFIENIPDGIGFDNSNFSVRIATGCAGNCAFCVIRRAIGKLKSKPVEKIIEEVNLAVSAGHYKLNILSSDTGAYGMDTGSSFPEVLRSIFAVDPGLKIAFVQDVNPLWICRYNVELAELVKSKRIVSILSPIQSGSPRVLKLMRRYNDVEDMARSFRQLKEAWPRLKIRTQVIIGFPTETDEEFEMTLHLINRCRFDEIDIFEYYEVKGSEAEKIFPKVPPEVIKKRMERIKREVQIPYRAVGSSRFRKFFRWYTKYD